MPVMCKHNRASDPDKFVKGANGKENINTIDVKCDEYLEYDGSNNVERLNKSLNQMIVVMMLRCGKKWNS